MNPTHRGQGPTDPPVLQPSGKSSLLEALLQLRDDIRRTIPLADAAARDQWQILERELYSAIDLVRHAKVDRHVVLHELRIRMERFARALPPQVNH